MAKRYIFVRMPVNIYNLYKGIKTNMEGDITKITGKPTKLTMPKVFKAVADPQLNENFIQVDLKKLTELARKKRGNY